MITIDFDEALHLYKECEAFQNGSWVEEDFSALRIKSQDVFQKSTVMHMEMTCAMVYRTLAQHYMKYNEDPKRRSIF